MVMVYAQFAPDRLNEAIHLRLKVVMTLRYMRDDLATAIKLHSLAFRGAIMQAS